MTSGELNRRSGLLIQMFQQFMVDQAVAGNDLTFHQDERLIVHLAHPSSSFFDDQHSRGHVPGSKLVFPESIHPSPGNMAEIQRGCSSPAYPLGPVREKLEVFHVA